VDKKKMKTAPVMNVKPTTSGEVTQNLALQNIQASF